MTLNERLLTIDELADYFHIGRVSVYRLINSGEIRSVRVGKRIRFRPEDIAAYLERGEMVPDLERYLADVDR